MRRTATVLAALAGFVPLPLPPGTTNTDRSSIQEFAASGDSFLAESSNLGDLQFSGDAAQTWRAVPLQYQLSAGASVGPDKGFWLPARGPNDAPEQLIHVTKEG